MRIICLCIRLRRRASAALGSNIIYLSPLSSAESLWPAKIGTTGNGGEVLQKNYDNPRVTVHVTTGNGGPPGPDNFCEDPSVPACRIASTNVQTTEFSYGRITAHNASHFTFQQFLNSNGSLFDEFTLVQDTHGPFGQGGTTM